MLNLQQTTNLLANPSKLTEKQLVLIRRLHRENLLKKGKLKSSVNTSFFQSVSGCDIRKNPALGRKYERTRFDNKLKFSAINPDSGDYVEFSERQIKVYKLAIAKGATYKEAVKLARQCP